MNYLESLPKTKISAPNVVMDQLFRRSSEILKSTRAECKNTFIKVDSKLQKLIIGGSQEKRQKAMMLLYEKLENKGIRFNELWRAAQNVDLVSSNSAVEDTGDHKKQILELKLANKELWGRVEELQRENQELHRKIKSWGTKINIKTEEPCSYEGDIELSLRKDLREIHEKYCKLEGILKLREMELEILKDSRQQVVQIE